MNIKEVSKNHNVSSDTLRYWERVGAIPPVRRDTRGYRDFDAEDLNWVYFTKCMRDIGVSIERIIEYISLFKQGDSTIPTRKELLIDQRNELAEKLRILNSNYDELDRKIYTYEEHMLSYEGKLRAYEKDNDT